MKATGRPPWFNVADLVVSEASHSTTKRAVSSIGFNVADSNSFFTVLTGACPGIRKRGGPKAESLFFFFGFSIFQGGPAQKLAEKMTFSTKKVAKYR